MPQKLSQEQFEKRVETLSNGRFSVKSKYLGRYEPILLHCNIHNIDFYGKGDWFSHGTDLRGNCPVCAKESKKERFKENQVEVTCAYCGKKFIKPLSKTVNSKSGLFFCCREHKDLAQRVESGYQFENIRPEHYNTSTSISTYRTFALRNYPNECAICHYKEDVDILEVHHIDENRENNSLNNLIILCPICHKKLTTHKYKLINRNQIIKK